MSFKCNSLHQNWRKGALQMKTPLVGKLLSCKLNIMFKGFPTITSFIHSYILTKPCTTLLLGLAMFPPWCHSHVCALNLYTVIHCNQWHSKAGCWLALSNTLIFWLTLNLFFVNVEACLIVYIARSLTRDLTNYFHIDKSMVLFATRAWTPQRFLLYPAYKEG